MIRDQVVEKNKQPQNLREVTFEKALFLRKTFGMLCCFEKVMQEAETFTQTFAQANRVHRVSIVHG